MTSRQPLAAFGCWIALACAPALGCLGNPGLDNDVLKATPSERTSVQAAALSGPVTRSQVLANAEQWVAAKLQYCQSANGEADGDTSCSPVCERQSNPLWDPYRSDCSGFVSWAWELPPPGLVTSEFAPFDTTASSAIACTDLEPGDAANRDPNVGHIVLFERWVTPGQEALFFEEPGCSSATPYAHEFDSQVTCNGNSIDITYEGDTFTAIRYLNIVDDPITCSAAEATCAADGDCCAGLTCQSGTCQTASTCDALWSACTSGSQCCSGLACLTWTPAGESAGRYCCEPVGASCTDGRQCCGGVNCTNGVCACVPTGSYCQNDADCCGGLACQSGACASAPAANTTSSASNTGSTGSIASTGATPTASATPSSSTGRSSSGTSEGTEAGSSSGTSSASTSSEGSSGEETGRQGGTTGGNVALSSTQGDTASGGCSAGLGDASLLGQALPFLLLGRLLRRRHRLAHLARRGPCLTLRRR